MYLPYLSIHNANEGACEDMVIKVQYVLVVCLIPLSLFYLRKAKINKTRFEHENS